MIFVKRRNEKFEANMPVGASRQLAGFFIEHKA